MKTSLPDKSHPRQGNSLTSLVKASLRPGWRALKRLGRKLRPRTLHNAAWVSQLNALNAGKAVKCAFDVGANRGQTTEEFVSLLPEAKIFAIEPIPEAAGEIEKRFADEPRVTVACLALDETQGERTFRLNAYNQTSSFLEESTQSPQRGYMALQRVIQVQTATFDAFCTEHGVSEIDVFKLDVQGYESAVLRGATEFLPRVKAIYAEVLFGRHYEGQTEYSELDLFLRERGFWLFRLYHESHAGDGRLLSADALWLNQTYYHEKDRQLDKWENELNRRVKV
jgi:FkbM family methyltransferase